MISTRVSTPRYISLHSDSSQETLEKEMILDPKKLSMWMRANEPSLNVEKQNLLYFEDKIQN